MIEERQTLLAPAEVTPLLATLRPDAIELHTRIGRSRAFAERLARTSAARAFPCAAWQ